jgi:hypothetical protein
VPPTDSAALPADYRTHYAALREKKTVAPQKHYRFWEWVNSRKKY